MKDPHSKNLHKFISNVSDPIHSYLTKTPKSFIENIYHKISDADEYWRKSIIACGRLSLDNSSEFRNHPEYTYIPKLIRDRLESPQMNRWDKKYMFELNHRKIKIQMIYPVQDSENIGQLKITRFFNLAIYKIYLWLVVAISYAPNKCSEDMNIFIYFSDHLKMLDDEAVPLGPLHSNTAFTTSCQTSTNIHIFRKEEWFKVFIHETFHNLGLDFSQMDSNLSNREIIKLFSITMTDVRLSESYAETWATIIHILFVVFLDKNRKGKIQDEIEKRLHYEIVFSVFQCAKILHYYGITYEQLIDSSSNIKTKYMEKTYILSYYIVKSILLTEPDVFIKWCIKQNGRTLEFHKTKENVLEYCSLIKQTYKTPRFLKHIQLANHWFSQIYSENNFLMKTLRMTIN